MRDRYQGGSLAGFIIIGVLLTLVLVGGLYGLNRYNAERTNTEVAKQDEPKQAESNKDDESTQTRDDSDTSGREAARNDDSQTGRADTDSDTDDSWPEDSSKTQTTTDLPETGPADTAFVFIVVGVVAFAATHYIQSRIRP